MEAVPRAKTKIKAGSLGSYGEPVADPTALLPNPSGLSTVLHSLFSTLKLFACLT